MRPFASLMDFSQSALFFDPSFQFVILHIPLQSVPRPLFRFLAVSFFTVTGCWSVAQLPTLRVRPPYLKPPGQCGPTIRPGTGYTLWSPFTTWMACSGTVLFAGHHTGHPSNASVISSVKWKGFPFAKKSTDLTWASMTYFCKYWMRNARLPNCLSFCTFLLHTAWNCEMRAANVQINQSWLAWLTYHDVRLEGVSATGVLPVKMILAESRRVIFPRRFWYSSEQVHKISSARYIAVLHFHTFSFFPLQCLTLCRSNLKPYCIGRKAAFFSAGI